MWAALAAVLIVVFGFALRALNPPASRIGVTGPQVVVPARPEPTPMPDAAPAPVP
jgi:hypothetical protein